MRTQALLAVLAVGLWSGWASAAELVMIDRPGCAYCARWDREVAPIYARADEGRRVPYRRVDIGAQAGLPLAAPARFTPTFVLIDSGREVGRITGYFDDGMFWGLLERLLAKLEADTGAAR